MATDLLPDEKALFDPALLTPCVSIILPFEPAISLKTELAYKVKTALDKAERDLKAGYTDAMAEEMMQRLRTAFEKLDYRSRKKAVAVYVSPVLEEIFDFDIPVEERIMVDESFEIRDLVYSKKEMLSYLLLELGSKESRLYLGNNEHLIRLHSGIPEHAAAFKNEVPGRVANFSDPDSRKEILLDKYMRHVDEGLGEILKKYALPVFMMGAARTAGHFRKISHQNERIVGVIHGNFSEANEAGLMKALGPHLAEWKKSKELKLLKQLDAAMGSGKLATGIRDVWKEAVHKRGRLLVVEKDYTVPARKGGQKDEIMEWDPQSGDGFMVRDAVDDIMEMVLLNGGDVEFVGEGVLKEYGRIALAAFY